MNGPIADMTAAPANKNPLAPPDANPWALAWAQTFLLAGICCYAGWCVFVAVSYAPLAAKWVALTWRAPALLALFAIGLRIRSVRVAQLLVICGMPALLLLLLTTAFVIGLSIVDVPDGTLPAMLAMLITGWIAWAPVAFARIWLRANRRETCEGWGAFAFFAWIGLVQLIENYPAILEWYRNLPRD